MYSSEEWQIKNLSLVTMLELWRMPNLCQHPMPCTSWGNDVPQKPVFKLSTPTQTGNAEKKTTTVFSKNIHHTCGRDPICVDVLLHTKHMTHNASTDSLMWRADYRASPTLARDCAVSRQFLHALHGCITLLLPPITPRSCDTPRPSKHTFMSLQRPFPRVVFVVWVKAACRHRALCCLVPAVRFQIK